MIPAAKIDRDTKELNELKLKKEALEQAKKTKSPTEIANAYLELGTLYASNPLAYFDNAKASFSEVLKLSVSADLKAQTLCKRGNLYEVRAAVEEAMTDYKEACKLEKDISDSVLKGKVFFEYAQSLITQEMYQEAVEPLRKARKYRPTSTRTLSLLVLALNQGKQPQNIFECLQAVGLSLEDIDAYAKEKRWLPVWLEAARTGALNIIESLAVLRGMDTRVCDEEGNNALHYAAMGGHVDLIEPLSLYLDYNSTNKAGYTPILLAAKMGKVAMVHALLAKGVKPFVHTDKLKTHVLIVAIAENQGCVCSHLFSDEILRKSLFGGIEVGALFLKAIEVKSLPILDILIKFFPKELNELYMGHPPLHHAVIAGYEKAVHLLVQEGANLVTENKDGKTALMLAESLNSPSTSFLRNYTEEKKAKEEAIIARYNNHSKYFCEKVQQQLQAKRPKLFETDAQKSENFERIFVVLGQAFNVRPWDKIFLNDRAFLDRLAELLVEALLKKAGNFINRKSIKDSTSVFSKHKLLPVISEFLNSNWEETLDRKPVIIEPSAGTSLAKREGIVLNQNQVAFCVRFEMQFDDAFSYFKGLASGELLSAQDIKDRQKADLAASAVSALKPEIPIPTFGLPIPSVSLPVGAMLTGAIELVFYLRQHYRKKEAERMMTLFKNVPPSERTHFIRYTAEQLAYKYEHQINHLFPGSGGVEQFADCAAARVVEYITSDDTHVVASSPSRIGNIVRIVHSWVFSKEIPAEQAEQKKLYDIFVDGILRVMSKFPKDLERLHTINNLTQTDNWNSKMIFENTGVITALGERYSHENCLIDKVGYCRGTKEEATLRNLSLGPGRGQLWTTGRVWEAVIDQTFIGQTPETHVYGQQSQQGKTTAFDPLYQTHQARSSVGMGVGSERKVTTEIEVKTRKEDLKTKAGKA